MPRRRAWHYISVGSRFSGGGADGGRQGNSGRAQGEAGGGTRGGADDEALAFVIDLGLGQAIQIGDALGPGEGCHNPAKSIGSSPRLDKSAP